MIQIRILVKDKRDDKIPSATPNRKIQYRYVLNRADKYWSEWHDVEEVLEEDENA